MTRSLSIGVAALALAVAGCGGGGTASPASEQRAAQQLLEQRDVARYAPGTPARALLDWWRSTQFADATAYRESFVPALRAELVADPHAADAVNYFAGSIRNARPRILNVDRRAGRATVYTMIEYHQPVGTKRYITSTVPRAFRVARVSGRWLLEDDTFVQTALPAFLRRRAASS